MKNLHSKRFAIVIFLVFAAVFGVVLYRNGVTTDNIWKLLSAAYKTIPIVLGAVMVFVFWAWKWPIFRGWLVPFPDLNGTWQGQIQTTWLDQATGRVPGPIPVIMTIKQSFINTSCVMRTAEMVSRSYLADFCLDDDAQIRKLGYCYHSQPAPSVQHRSTPHDGTAVLEVIGEGATRKLKGTYWTTRNTTGEITLVFSDRKRAEEFPSQLGPHPVSGRTESPGA